MVMISGRVLHLQFMCTFQIKKLSRWEVIDVVRTMSTEQAKAGQEGESHAVCLLLSECLAVRNLHFCLFHVEIYLTAELLKVLEMIKKFLEKRSIVFWLKMFQFDHSCTSFCHPNLTETSVLFKFFVLPCMTVNVSSLKVKIRTFLKPHSCLLGF